MACRRVAHLAAGHRHDMARRRHDALQPVVATRGAQRLRARAGGLSAWRPPGASFRLGIAPCLAVGHMVALGLPRRRASIRPLGLGYLAYLPRPTGAPDVA